MIDKIVLEQLYIVEKNSSTTIAKKLNVSVGTVLNYLKKFDIPVRNRRDYFDNLKKQKFDKWFVLDEEPEIIVGNTGQKRYWKCQCKCGTIKRVCSQNLITHKSKSCGKCITRSGENSWKGHGKISGSYWSRIKNRAKERGLIFTVTIEEAWIKFINQNGKCAYSGEELSHKDKTASLDRISSDKDYTNDNIQWVHKQVNFMKSNLSEKNFLDLVKKIQEYKNL